MTPWRAPAAGLFLSISGALLVSAFFFSGNAQAGAVSHPQPTYAQPTRTITVPVTKTPPPTKTYGSSPPVILQFPTTTVTKTLPPVTVTSTATVTQPPSTVTTTVTPPPSTVTTTATVTTPVTTTAPASTQTVTITKTLTEPPSTVTETVTETGAAVTTTVVKTITQPPVTVTQTLTKTETETVTETAGGTTTLMAAAYQSRSSSGGSGTNVPEAILGGLFALASLGVITGGRWPRRRRTAEERNH